MGKKESDAKIDFNLKNIENQFLDLGKVAKRSIDKLAKDTSTAFKSVGSGTSKAIKNICIAAKDEFGDLSTVSQENFDNFNKRTQKVLGKFVKTTNKEMSNVAQSLKSGMENTSKVVSKSVDNITNAFKSTKIGGMANFICLDISNIGKSAGDMENKTTKSLSKVNKGCAEVEKTAPAMGEKAAESTKKLGSAVSSIGNIVGKLGKSTVDVFSTMGKGLLNLAQGAMKAGSAFFTAFEEFGSELNLPEGQFEKIQGQISSVKDGASQIGKALLGSVSSSMGDVVGVIGAGMGEVNEAFNSGGIDGMLMQIGPSVASALGGLAQMAPGMMDSAVQMTESFASGIQKNLPQISENAMSMGAQRNLCK